MYHFAFFKRFAFNVLFASVAAFSASIFCCFCILSASSAFASLIAFSHLFLTISFSELYLVATRSL